MTRSGPSAASRTRPSASSVPGTAVSHTRPRRPGGPPGRRSGASRAGVAEAEPHPADVRLVRDAGLVGLEDDRVTDRGRRGQGRGAASRRRGPAPPEAVVAQQVEERGAAQAAGVRRAFPASACRCRRADLVRAAGLWARRGRAGGAGRAGRCGCLPGPGPRPRAAGGGGRVDSGGSPESTTTGLEVRAAAVSTARG